MNIRPRLEEIIDSLDNNSISYEDGVNQLHELITEYAELYYKIRRLNERSEPLNNYYHLSKPWGDGIDTINTAHNINTHNLPKENNEPFTKCPRCESDSVITYTCDHINCKECKCNFQYGFRNEKQK